MGELVFGVLPDRIDRPCVECSFYNYKSVSRKLGVWAKRRRKNRAYCFVRRRLKDKVQNAPVQEIDYTADSKQDENEAQAGLDDILVPRLRLEEPHRWLA